MLYSFSSFSLTWDGLELTTNGSAPVVRNIFTAICLVVNILIAFTGERLIMRHRQRQLLKNKTLPLTDLSPFLSVISTLKYFWMLRRLPGGLFGPLMIASGVFGLTGHIFINTFVETEQVAHLCTFDSGVVTTHEPSNFDFSSSAAWTASQVVLRAQQAAITNNDTYPDCAVGIYSKVNQNVTTFCPTQDDVLGNWVCIPQPSSVMAPADRVNETTIENFIQQSNFSYSYPQTWRGRIGNDGKYSDLMVWSTNTTGGSTARMNVRGQLVTGLNANSSFTTSNFQCTLHVSNSTWSPVSINNVWTLTEWASTMLGSILDTPSELFQGELELVLNAISMVSGSSNSIFDAAKASALGAGEMYGCKEDWTVTHPPVFVIVLVLISILLAILIADLLDLVLNAKDKNRAIVASLPIDLIEWQLAMAKKLVNDDRITTRDLFHCEYSYNRAEGTIDCKRAEKKGSAVYHPPSEMVSMDKLTSGNEPRCTYVWNSNYKTIECQKRTSECHQPSEDPVASASDVDISMGKLVFTSTPR
ncbi:hypothetical protein EG329_006821 [Mollisiaceae sp. DMI_Dod_QoI]|nr:hypothetical protein EG329_006821 [Helotiales sp. DMI_Dod_QoI]